MIIRHFILGNLANNNYLVIDEDSREAVLIDCTAPNREILDTLQEQKAVLKYILLTHGHFDHILGVDEMQKATGAKSLISMREKELIQNTPKFMRQLGMPPAQPPKIDIYFNDDILLTLGKEPIQIIPTPGHSMGGVSYLIQDCLFSGDTLFHQGVGRTDFDFCNAEQLRASVRYLLLNLDDKIRVFPGHGPTTTIGAERKFFGLKK